jgi:hypothetical protein
MTFTALPLVGMFRFSCASAVRMTWGATTPLIPTLAGAFQTPQVLSTIA